MQHQRQKNNTKYTIMKNQKNIAQTLKIIALAVALSFGLSYVYAWTAPTSLPPGGNTSAPINTATSTQIKSGALGVTNFVANSVTVGGTPNAGAALHQNFVLVHHVSRRGRQGEVQ
jgi:hypothetical protein